MRNVGFCVVRGIFTQADADRLTASLATRAQIGALSRLFDVSAGQMADAALDAALAYMRAVLLEDGAASTFLPLPPVPAAGWKELSENPDEWAFYDGVCIRLCQALGIRPGRLVRREPVVAQAVDVHQSTARVVAALQRHQIPHVPAHWALNRVTK